MSATYFEAAETIKALLYSARTHRKLHRKLYDSLIKGYQLGVALSALKVAAGLPECSGGYISDKQALFCLLRIRFFLPAGCDRVSPVTGKFC